MRAMRNLVLAIGVAGLSSFVVLATNRCDTRAHDDHYRHMLGHQEVDWQGTWSGQPVGRGLFVRGERYPPGSVVSALHPLHPERMEYIKTETKWAPFPAACYNQDRNEDGPGQTAEDLE